MLINNAATSTGSFVLGTVGTVLLGPIGGILGGFIGAFVAGMITNKYTSRDDEEAARKAVREKLFEQARETLGVAKEDPFVVIRKAYFIAMRKYHPDMHPNATIEENQKLTEKTQQIHFYYTLLHDEHQGITGTQNVLPLTYDSSRLSVANISRRSHEYFRGSGVNSNIWESHEGDFLRIE
jgi:hypothetical protein